VKIVSADSKIVVEEEYEEVDDLEELAEELPECQPRYPLDTSIKFSVR